MALSAYFTLFLISLLGVLIGCNPMGTQEALDSNLGKRSTASTAENFDPNVVLFGQNQYGTDIANNASPTAFTVKEPSTMIKVGTKLIVLDSGNNRILIFGSDLTSGANTVLGQIDLNHGPENNNSGSPSSKGLNYPYQIASDGTRLAVADYENHRVLVWNTIPTSSNVAADVVIGQPDFATRTINYPSGSATDKNLYNPCGVAFAGGKLFISDFSNHRVLGYNSPPSSNYAAADFVLGQANFTSNSANRGGGVASNSFRYPFYITTNGTKLGVIDYYNSRMLIWNTIPSSDVAADVVVGQPNFTSNSGATDQDSLRYPYGAYFVGSGLYVADAGSHRLLYWSSLPASGSAGNAAGVFGQPNFTSGNANQGGTSPAADSLYIPFDVFYDGSKFYVSDGLNHRILIFNSPPTGVGTDTADAVFGQSSSSLALPNMGVTNQSGFFYPSAMTVTNKHLVVLDSRQNRCLVFDKFPTAHGPSALAVMGQTSMSGSGGGLAANRFDFSNLGGLASDNDGRIYISDSANNRVLIYNQVPSSSGANADYVLGQPNFTSNTVDNGNTNQELNSPTALSINGSKLYVSDSGSHRVLVFDLPITANHAAASNVIGQPDFNTKSSGITALKYNWPWATLENNGAFYVVDASNYRILGYSSTPTVPNSNADILLGSANFTTQSWGTSATRFYPTDDATLATTQMAVYNGYLLFPDSYNYRILGFDISNLSIDTAATYVWGQPSFSTYEWKPRGNPEQETYGVMLGPTGVHVDPFDDYIWVAEYYANRVLRIKAAHFWERKKP